MMQMQQNEETKEGDQEMHQNRIRSAVQDALTSLGVQMSHQVNYNKKTSSFTSNVLLRFKGKKISEE